MTSTSTLVPPVNLTLHRSPEVVAKSQSFLAILEFARKIAKSTVNVLIRGESGTGKEILANFIHENSARASGPFIAINCSAIPEALIESELFGHSRGAFTGAENKKTGLFEEADGGTLFLDEIGDLDFGLQAKILRVLQERKVKRVGENSLRPIDVRIVSATHRNLWEEVLRGNFRKDLYYRLNVVPIYIPPLRARPEDIMPLAEHFLRQFAEENGSPAKSFSSEAEAHLAHLQWQGNVRELRNVIERATALCSGNVVQISDFNSPCMDSTPDSPAQTSISVCDGNFIVRPIEQLPPLRAVIEKYIEFAVSHNNGAKDKTAREIGIDRKTLYKRLRYSNDATVPDSSDSDVLFKQHHHHH